MFKNPFVFKIPEAELFGTATTFEDFNVQLDDNNKVAYWTENTILPSGTNYFYTGTTSGNIWHIFENHTYPDIYYGLAVNQILSGDIHFIGKNLNLKNVVFTGGALSKCNDVYIDLYNVSPSGAAYCIGGECNNAYINLVSGNYGTTTSTATNFYIIQRGSALNNVKTTINNIYFTCNESVFNNMLIIGPSIKTKAAATNVIFETNDIFATLNSGQTTQNSHSNNVFIGGAYSGQTDKYCAIINNCYTVINGGTWLDSNNTVNGVGIYSGPLIYNGIVTISGNCNMIMNDGDVSILYSGGYVQNDGKLDILGDISITFNGGIVGNLLAVETAESVTSKTGYNHIHGNSYIYINGGVIKEYVNPGSRHSQTGDKGKIYGECYVILNGNSNYNCIFYGGYNNGSNRESHIIFENYTGSLSGATIKQFKDIQFTKNCSVDLFNTNMTNNDNLWTFDISRRSISNSNAPMITMSAPSTPFDIKLIINDQNTIADYKLYLDNEATTFENWDHKSMNIIIYYGETVLFDDSSIQIIDEGDNTITLCEISGTSTIFDGYGLKLIRDYNNSTDSIVFTKIS